MSDEFATQSNIELSTPEKPKVPLLAQTPLRSRTEMNLRPSYTDIFVPNEIDLVDATARLTKERKGVGLGVGLDQMLDFAINSQLEKIYMVDNQVEVSLATTALLEVATILGRKHGEVTPDMLVSCFDPDNFQQLEDLLEQSTLLTVTDQQNIASILHAGNFWHLKQLHEYLSYKRDSVPDSWVGSVQNLRKIRALYEAGNIVIYAADLAGDDVVQFRIREQLQSEQKELGLLYVSNAMKYIAKEGKMSALQRNIEAVPKANDCLIVQTLNVSMLPEYRGLVERPLPRQVQKHPFETLEVIPWMYILRNDMAYFLEHAGNQAGLQSSYGRFDGKEGYVDKGVLVIGEGIVPKMPSVIDSVKGFFGR